LSDHLKIAVVKPLYKNGNKTNVTNYRPISLLAVFYKVLEKPKHSRLCQHLHTNNILVAEQYGLGKGYQLKMLPSDQQILNSNLLIKKCTLEEFYMILQGFVIA